MRGVKVFGHAVRLIHIERGNFVGCRIGGVRAKQEMYDEKQQRRRAQKYMHVGDMRLHACIARRLASPLQPWRLSCLHVCLSSINPLGAVHQARPHPALSKP